MNDFNPKRILSPVDLSPVSGPVLQWAGFFATAYGAAVEVFHADHFEAPIYFTSGQLAALNEEMAAQRAGLEQMVERLAGQTLSPEVSRSVKITEGPATHELQKELERQPPDLVVMGAHGRTGVKRVLLGSVAENLVRFANCPVLIVPMRGENVMPPEIRVVLSPVNFTTSSRQSLLVAGSLARASNGELHVLHAAEDSGESEEVVRTRLCSWIPGDLRTSCALTETVRAGNAAEQIIHFARESRADVIVMAADHSPFLEWSTIGTTTIRVMRHSDIPVLIVPKQGD
jgi:nucleotide-binding universal stress UspA family protein